MIHQTAKEKKLADIVGRSLNLAEGSDQDEVSANREAALNAYRSAPLKGDSQREEDALSTSQDTSIRDMVHACLAQILPMISTDCVVQFEPDGEQDEDAARAESAVVDHVIMAKNNGFIELEEAIHDALLTRNGWLKVAMQEKQVKERIPLPAGMEVPPEVLAMLLQPKAANEERSLNKDASVIQVVTTNRKFIVAAVPGENMRFTANAVSSDLEDIPFIAEFLPDTTRSDLVERGISKEVADQLPAMGDPSRPTASRSRDRTSQSRGDRPTRDQDLIEVYECHVRADINGDGISDLYRTLYSNGFVLECEEVDHIPYATGSPFIAPHRITGMSLYDVLREVQSTKTVFLRRFEDGITYLTYGRWGVDEQSVNMDDVLSSQHVIRTQGAPAGAITPLLTDPTIPPTLIAALQYMDTVRTQRGGAALEMQSAELQIAGETAHGVERQTSLREMLTSLMAKNLAETLIRRVWLLTHRYLRLYSNQPVAMKVAGQWTEVDPTQWRFRERLNVRAGLSAGEKARKLGSMTQMIQFQTMAAQAGLDGVLTDYQSGYEAMMDWCALADIDNPSRYWINPSSPQSQQAQQQKQQAAQQQGQQMQQLIAAQINVEMEKVRKDITNQERELAFKYWEARLKAETEEAKIVATGTVELEKVQLQGEQREREILAMPPPKATEKKDKAA